MDDLRTRNLWTLSAVSVILIVHTVALGWSATWQSPTLNEPGHLASGVAIWKLGRFDAYRVNPPLVRAIAAVHVVLAGCQTNWQRLAYGPGVRCEFDLGIDFMNANGIDSIRLFNLARWACIPFSVLGGWCCFLWGRALCGNLTGVLACSLWCFSPNVLAYGQLIAPDIAGASLMLLASYRFWIWLKECSWGNATVAGMAMGCSLLAKSSSVILIAIWPLIWCFQVIVIRKQRIAGSLNRTELSQLVSIIAVAGYLVNLGYLFDGTMTRLGDYQFVSKALGDPPAGKGFGNVYRTGWLAKVPVPLPKEFVLGIDHQKKDFEDFPFPSYLRGEWRKTGWWYYYLYGLGVKVPVGTLCLVILAMISSPGMLKNANPDHVTGWATLWIPGLVVIVMISCQPTLFHHFRYVLPLFGPMFVFAATVPAAVHSWRRNVRGIFYLASAACIVSTICSTVRAAPGFISYFNAFAGGAQRGRDHLIHSNLDWGQDLYLLKQWIQDNSIDEPVHLAYHGLFDPSAIGVSYVPAPYGPTWDGRAPVAEWTPGLYAISVNYLMGDTWRLSTGRDYKFLEKETPIHICGDTIYVFRIR
jgi:hypothetical protein